MSTSDQSWESAESAPVADVERRRSRTGMQCTPVPDTKELSRSDCGTGCDQLSCRWSPRCIAGATARNRSNCRYLVVTCL